MHLLRDLRFAARTLVRNPGFSIIAVVTLALGIGANTAVFSVVNTVLLQPLPYEDAEDLALIWTNFGPDLPQNWISGPEFREMQEFNTTFEDISVVVPFSVSVTSDGQPEQVTAAAASGGLFQTLRVNPHRGRLLTDEDDVPGADPVAVISHGFWTRRYGQDPDILGRGLIANGIAYQIAGVLPPDFRILHPDAQFPNQVDVWAAAVPAFAGGGAAVDYAQFPRGNHGLRGIGRVRAGVTMEQAQAGMDRVAQAILERTPNYYGNIDGWGLTVYSMHEDLVEDVNAALWVLMGAVAFVLLIACVNVANLQLARAASREREIAVRAAIGAAQKRLFTQVLTENVVLALAGGALGLFTAFVAVKGIVAFAPDNLPRRLDIAVDGTVLLVTLLVAVGTGLLFGLAPALHGFRTNLSASVKEGARGTTAGGAGKFIRSSLVVAEVGLAVVLLVGAGLMIRSFVRLTTTDPGYQTESLLTARIALPGTNYAGTQVTTFYDQLLMEVRALPGVENAGLISQLPLSGAYSSGTTVVDQSETVPPDQLAVEIDRRRVSMDYFEAMGVELKAGRTFHSGDNADGALVAIVDEEFVKRFWPTENPIGRRVSINTDANGRVWREVVGVVGHSKHYGLDRVGREQAYFPYAQTPVNTMFLAVQTTVDPQSLTSAIREAVWSLDGEQPVSDVRTMEERASTSVAQPRFTLMLLAAFAGVALLLAAIGIYGVLAYSVGQRTHEIGVRMALGARPGDVRSLVLKQGGMLVGIGLLVGTAGAFVLTRLASSLLFEISPTDPMTYVLVVVGLTGIGLAACYLPARRATTVEPVTVLSAE